jgi:hypothetical protein
VKAPSTLTKPLWGPPTAATHRDVTDRTRGSTRFIGLWFCESFPFFLRSNSLWIYFTGQIPFSFIMLVSKFGNWLKIRVGSYDSKSDF